MPLLQIGSLQLSSPVIYSPLAGCSDFPFRQMSAKYKPALMFCEMVKMEPLIRRDKNTYRMLDYNENMRPIGAQLCGSNPDLAGETAQILEGLGFDLIDLNCGCPVDKVTKDGSGSGMLKRLDLIGETLSRMIMAVKIPITLKIRAGWDENNIVVEEITRIAEQAGAKAIFIHGRTRKQAYKGPANWDYIKAGKDVAKTIKVIGNGDLFQPEDVIAMQQHTGCDGFLISRGTLGQPWIVRDIMAILRGERPTEISLSTRKADLQEHFEYVLAYRGDDRTPINMRRVGCWYLKDAPQIKELRYAMSRASSVGEIRELIDKLK